MSSKKPEMKTSEYAKSVPNDKESYWDFPY